MSKNSYDNISDHSKKVIGKNANEWNKKQRAKGLRAEFAKAAGPAEEIEEIERLFEEAKKISGESVRWRVLKEVFSFYVKNNKK